MKLLRYTLFSLLILVALFGLLLLAATLADWKPEERITIDQSTAPDTVSVGGSLNILTWNIGYCGLGKDMDFFYDGGNRVRDSKENTLKNLHVISKFLISNDSVDLMLLQEVDINSKRTYQIDEVSEISTAVGYSNHYFSPNFKVFFIPIPLTEPIGGVLSGLMTISKPKASLVDRYDFPGSYPWPKNLFMLDRCFMVTRIPLSNRKDLLVINTHNSAFDGGTLKKHEMQYLKAFVLNEYSKGNYVIVGGDWNQNPPGFDPSVFSSTSGYENFILEDIPSDFLPEGWTWNFDISHPTNRALTAAYKPGETATTTLDFFLCSPNIIPGEVRTIDLGFENSDHQPVLISVKFYPKNQ